MKPSYKIIFTSLMTLVVITTHGQSDCCWFGDKPTTKLDSLTIQKEKIKSIYIYYNYVTDTGISKKLSHYIDISDCCYQLWCFQLIKEEKTNGKIVQTIQWDTDKSKLIYERTHYLDIDGRIVMTENKFISGPSISRPTIAFKKIVYEYKDNLLFNAKYYLKSDNLPFFIIEYVYKK